MPVKQTLQLQHKLPENFEIIYGSLLDLRKFGELHPHMKEVRVTWDNSPEFIEYHITEEVFLFGFIKNRPKYTAKVIELEKNKRILYTSQVKPSIFLNVDFTFTQNKKGEIVVNETIELNAGKLISMIFLGMLKRAHLQFFENLNLFLQNSVEDIEV
jgi:hypothetical protein